MIAFVCGIKNMTQMNLLQDRFTDIENRLLVAKAGGGGKEWIGSLGLADVNYHT